MTFLKLLLYVHFSCHHELETARLNGLLGNIDANTGDPQIGINQISNSLYLLHSYMITLDMTSRRRSKVDY